MPQPPVISVAFKSLFGASKGLSIFSLSAIAVSDIAPCLSFSVIDRDGVSEAEDSFIEVFYPHVGTSTGEPLSREKLVDLETLLETVN